MKELDSKYFFNSEKEVMAAVILIAANPKYTIRDVDNNLQDIVDIEIEGHREAQLEFNRLCREKQRKYPTNKA